MTSATDRALVVGAFDGAVFPGGEPTLDTAWLGIYQVLWWYQKSPQLEWLETGAVFNDAPTEVLEARQLLKEYLEADSTEMVLHVREANDLTKRPWVAKAQSAEAYIAGGLGVRVDDLRDMLDRMMKLSNWKGKQRNNPLGNGLRILLREVLSRWGNATLDFNEEAKATEWFPGIKLPGRSQTPSVDVAAERDSDPVALMSCKWSIRHDRISDPTNECQEYKAAAIKRQNMKMKYYVFTNELDGQRLDKVLNQPCVDGLVHVHLPLVTHLLGGPTDAMVAAQTGSRLLDLTDLVAATASW